MIYILKVRAAAGAGEPLETTHCPAGGDVLGAMRDLIAKYPQCEGVEVLILGSSLFFMERDAADQLRRA